MTSRNSFSSLMKEDIKQRLWNVILVGIMVILPITIALAMTIGDLNVSGTFFTEESRPERLYGSIAGLFGETNVWLYFMTVLAAVLCAASGFEYCFSRKKTDFFHSLPVKRETLFWVRYLNGILIFTVPYILMLLISMVMLGARGWMSGNLALVMLVGMAFHFLGFLIVYSVAILATQLAGMAITWIGVFSWVNCFVPLIVFTVIEMMDKQYATFCSMDIETMLLKLRWFSPGLYYCLWMPENAGRVTAFRGGVGYVLGYWAVTLLYAAVLTAVALLAYKKRSSESAGKAICFSFMKPILLVSVSVTSGILSGVFLMSLVEESRETGWGLVGCLIGVVLCHMLMQSIFHSDVKKCFAQWKIMIGCAVLSCVVVVGIRIDPFHYDEYMPKKSSLEEIDISIYGQLLAPGYIKVGDLDAGYDFVKYVKEHRTNTDEGYWYDSADVMNLGISEVTVAYKKKSGHTIYREYDIPASEIAEHFGPVYESEGYREKMIPLMYGLGKTKPVVIFGYYGDSEVRFTLSEQEKKELIDTALQELKEISWNEMLRTSQVAQIGVSAFEESTGPSDFIPVYASCTKTLEFMQNHGLVNPYTYSTDRIESVCLHSWWDQELFVAVKDVIEQEVTKAPLTQEEQDMLQAYLQEGLPIFISDFEQLKPALVPYSMANDYGAFSDCLSGYVEVMVSEDDYGNSKRYMYRIRKGADISFLFRDLYFFRDLY